MTTGSAIDPGAEFRLLPYQVGGAAQNMAVDQAILESVDAGGPATIRFYGWSEPTLSLGYFQMLADRSLHHFSADAPVVRRSSGGGAILHDRELTYSVCVPQPSRLVGTRLDLYAILHGAIARVLAGMGITAIRFADLARPSPDDRFLCFQRRTDEDLVCAGYKILGSAQRRGRKAVLQHGSLLLHASEMAPELPGVGDLAGHRLTASDVASKLQIDLNEAQRWRLTPALLTNDEQDQSSAIMMRRFGSPAWTQKR